jgi:hypothetical protein
MTVDHYRRLSVADRRCIREELEERIRQHNANLNIEDD